MRISSLYLPTHDNSGVEQRDVHAALQLTLIDTFGGFTRTMADGGWRDGATGRVQVESVVVYHIVMSDNEESRSRLRFLASVYGSMTQQVCVLVIHANGAAEFIDCSTHAVTVKESILA